jgi:hypothetical protein
LRRYEVVNLYDGRVLWITLYKGPYTKKRILWKTGWPLNEVEINEQKQYRNTSDGTKNV